MAQERRFGKRVTQPSSVQIVHELKLMALRQSLDAATAREAAAAGGAPAAPAAEPQHHVRVRDAATPSTSDAS